MDPKHPHDSWTYNANLVLLFLVAVLQLDEFRAIVHPSLWPYLLAANAIANMALRFRTDRPISFRAPRGRVDGADTGEN